MRPRFTYTVLLGGLLLLGLGLPTAATAQPIIFQELLVGSPPAVRFGDAAWGDFDGDGDFDLFLTGSVQRFEKAVPLTQLYRNDGDTVVLIENPATGAQVQVPGTQYVDAINPTLPTLEDVWQSAVAWGDYDNDGDLDVLATGINTAGVLNLRVYENVGGNSFLASRFTLPGTRDGDLDWGDYDNDGDLDFVVCGTGEDDRPRSVIYENQTRSGGGFVRRDAGLDALAFCSVEWGDYDNDGDLDVLMTGVAEPQAFLTRIYRNDGHGNFSALDAGLKGLLYASVAWGDYDADGDLDILLSGATLTPFIMVGELKVYRNDSGAFTDISDGLLGSFENDVTRGRYQGDAAWGDFNNDGRLDFFITGAKDPLGHESLQLYRNILNDEFFKSPTERFDGGLFGGALWGDYDNDNDLDIFVLGEEPVEGVSIKALRNGLSFNNLLPSAPDGLQATTQGNTATLTWNPGSDIQTPTPGLTYNLRVGATPGGVDIVSPMATATGHRLVPRRGNAGHNTSWTLKNLPLGTYFWSVQTLDNSFKGSPFAPEGTFTIGG